MLTKNTMVKYLVKMLTKNIQQSYSSEMKDKDF